MPRWTNVPERKYITMTVFTKANQLKESVRKPIHEEVAQLELSNFERMPNGEFVKNLGTIEGRPINAVVRLSITTRTEFEKSTKAKAPKEVKEVNLESIFD